MLQLVDAVTPAARRALQRELPGVRLVQVVHVSGPESIDEARQVAETAHAIVLDSGNPNLEVKELGGTGRRHDWAISAQIRERVDVPVLLGGGLKPENAAEALATVRPWALDVCSGLRDTNAVLIPERLESFASAMQAVTVG